MSFDGIVLTLLAVLAGLFVGFARQGRLLAVAANPVRAKSLLVIGVVVPALAERFTREVAVPLVVAGLAALFAFAIVNVRIVGMSVLAIGVLANLLATFLNGGLPVDRDALVEAGLATRAEVDRVELRGARRLEEPTQRLRFLGDVIPLPETGQVLSFGDLVVLVGLADVTANLTLRRRARRRTGAVAEGTAVEGEAAEYYDDDEFALPDVEEWLFAGIAFTPTVEGERPDPRPHPRTRVVAAPLPEDDTAWVDRLAADADDPLPDRPPLEDPSPLEVPLDDRPPLEVLLDELEPAPETAPASGAVDAPDVAWWPAASTPEPAALEPALEPDVAIDLTAEPRWAAPTDDADASALVDAAPDLGPLATEPRWAAGPETAVLDDVVAAEAAAAEDAILETAIADDDVATEHAVVPLDEPTLEIVTAHDPVAGPLLHEREPTGPTPVLDLRDDDPDALLRAIFADLTPRRRTRRRGSGRNIPDFEPIHLDDAVPSRP